MPDHELFTLPSGRTEPGDICEDCALIGLPGALCPKHARQPLVEAINAALVAACKLALCYMEFGSDPRPGWGMARQNDMSILRKVIEEANS